MCIVYRAHRRRRSHMETGPRPLVARPDGQGIGRMPRRAAGCGSIRSTSSTLRYDREAEGHRAHHRRATLLQDVHHHEWVFDLTDEDIYWCTADIGWVTGHSYVVYGPLAERRDRPDVRRRAELSRATASGRSSRSTGSTIFYTAPTAIRAFIKWGDQLAEEARSVEPAPAGHGRRSRSIPKPGCGITSMIGGERCPIVDTWWQTETGGIMIAPAAGRDSDQARLGARSRCPASVAEVVDAATASRSAKTQGGYAGDHASRGRRCCAPSGATTSATSSSTGQRSRASISPATAPGATTTATTGSWAASTT